MFLFFDTETTGLPKFYNAPINDLENWPRLVQLAWLMMDENGQELSSQNLIIRPEGFEIPEAASRVHGITTERAEKEGVDLSESLQEFSQAVNNVKVLVAHNISFDEKIMGAELLRKQIESSLFDRVKICTMHEATDYCQIPGQYGYKWPRLTELHEKLFNEGFDNAHDALADVRACAKCFFELINKGIIKN